MTRSILIQQHYLRLSPHTHTHKTILPDKTFWNKHVTNNNNSRGCLRMPSCTITHLPVPRTCRGGKWAKKSDCLVSFGNTSPHSTAYRSELHSENKHFKSCLPVVWPKALTRGWIQAFYNAALWCCHFGIILNYLSYSDHREISSFWVHADVVCCYLFFPLLAQVGAINLKPRDRTYASNVTWILVSVSQTFMLYLL